VTFAGELTILRHLQSTEQSPQTERKALNREVHLTREETNCARIKSTLSVAVLTDAMWTIGCGEHELLEKYTNAGCIAKGAAV